MSEVGGPDPLVGEDRIGTAQGNQHAEVEHTDAVGESQRQVEVVIDNDDRHALVAKRADQLSDLASQAFQLVEPR